MCIQESEIGGNAFVQRRPSRITALEANWHEGSLWRVFTVVLGTILAFIPWHSACAGPVLDKVRSVGPKELASRTIACLKVSLTLTENGSASRLTLPEKWLRA